MKLKLWKPNRVQWLVIAAVVVMIALVMGNRDQSAEPASAGLLDEAAKRTCDEFTAGYPDAKTRTERLGLADRAVVASARTDNEAIADRAGELGRRSGDSKAWKAGAEALIGACRDAGWTGSS